MISLQYAGTGALKTDFTRTGTRTKFGLLQDGWNSAVRYVLNTFCDGDRTDALRYFVGEASAHELLAGRSKVLYPGGPFLYLPIVFFLLQLVVIFTLICKPEGVWLGTLATSPFEIGINYLLMVVIGICSTIAVTKVMLANGRPFVNYPKTITYALR